MKKREGVLKAFTVYDLLLIAMFTALAVAFKAIVKILIGFVATPLGIPGGSLAGGLYMLWMPLALGIVGKRGTALLMTLIQSLIIFITGMPGSHGIWTFLTYMSPALTVEIVCVFSRSGKYNIIHFIAACIFANLAGTVASNILFFQITNLAVLIFMFSAAAFSGAVGGVLGYMVYKSALKSGLVGKLSGEVGEEKQVTNYKLQITNEDDVVSPFERMEKELTL